MNRNSKPSPIDVAAQTWAISQLGLKRDETQDPDRLMAASANAFFRGLRSADYHAEQESIDAVEIIFGASPPTVQSFVDSIERQNLLRIDAIVAKYASQLGELDRPTMQADLRRQLQPFDNPEIDSATRDYANQVLLAAEIAISPLVETNLVAREIAKCIFHISAIRPSQRRAVRTRLVRELQQRYSDMELFPAIRQLKSNYRLPNKKFHQPFLSLLQWNETKTELFKIGEPVSSETQSVVAYSKEFGRKAPATQSTNTGFSWGWVMFAIILGGLLPALGRLGDSANSSPTIHSVSTPKTPTVPVIVWDKDDPNKYAVEFVEFKDSFGRETRAQVSPEHPGPLYDVPLHEINRADNPTERPILGDPGSPTQKSAINLLERIIEDSRSSARPSPGASTQPHDSPSGQEKR